MYPKAIARTKLHPKRNQCFVLMPFSQEFDEIYSEMKGSLRAAGFECVRADDLYSNRPIMTTISCEIITSHFIIADLTDKSPNVFYEVGIAHSLRDIASVILIAQSVEFVPFDLRHLPIIIYTKDNLKGLTTKLIKIVLENKDFFAGQARIRERYGHQVGTDSDLEDVLAYLEEQGRNIWPLLLTFLEVTDAIPPEGEVIGGLFHFRGELASLLSRKDLRLFHSLFKIFRDLVVKYLDIPVIAEYVAQTLRQYQFSEFAGLDPADSNSLLIDLALAVYHHPRFKRRAIEWILGYLARPKVAGIDINRSRVEFFVMYASDPDIREALLYSLESETMHLREVAADFLGEMRLREGVPNLIFLLSRETGPYVVRSIFSALGKIGSDEGALPILEWLRSHRSEIRERQWDFIVRHAEHALMSIDQRNGTTYVAKFTELSLEATLL